jgi:hypothetical protein
MEVPCSAEDDRTTLRDPLLLICPLTRKFDARLDRFSPCVHRQNHIISKELRNLLGEEAKKGIVECPRGERQTLGLLHQSCHNAGVAVALINGATVMSMVSSGTG